MSLILLIEKLTDASFSLFENMLFGTCFSSLFEKSIVIKSVKFENKSKSNEPVSLLLFKKSVFKFDNLPKREAFNEVT